MPTSPIACRSAILGLQAALQNPPGTGSDSLGLASSLNVAFADFANVGVKIAGTSIAQTDAAAQPVRGLVLAAGPLPRA